MTVNEALAVGGPPVWPVKGDSHRLKVIGLCSSIGVPVKVHCDEGGLGLKSGPLIVDGKLLGLLIAGAP